MTFYLSAKEKQQIISFYQPYEISNNNPYVEKFFRYKDITITVYKDKVLFQGPYAEIINEYRDHWCIFDKKEVFVIGNDEVGTGDYFGPIVITSCYIGSAMMEKLRRLAIRDSKDLQDKKIYELANSIMKIVTFESVIINNRKYNQWIAKGYNANVIKAWGHNQALVKILQHKSHYNKVVIDEFVKEKTYFKYLENMVDNKNKIIRDKVEFTQKAENKYLAVACSAIISRYLFLEEIKKISSDFQDQNIPLGSGFNVDSFLINNKHLIGKDFKKFLLKNTKYHFANTKKILQVVDSKKDF